MKITCVSALLVIRLMNRETNTGVTALVDVYDSQAINNGVEKHNIGIVSYNKELLVYIALEFDICPVIENNAAGLPTALKLPNRILPIG